MYYQGEIEYRRHGINGTDTTVANANKTTSPDFHCHVFTIFFLQRRCKKREPLTLQRGTSVFISWLWLLLRSASSLLLTGSTLVGASCERLSSSIILEGAVSPTDEPMSCAVHVCTVGTIACILLQPHELSAYSSCVHSLMGRSFTPFKGFPFARRAYNRDPVIS